ncbi:energy-coupling factor transporter transmembrane component T family protein [Actinomycetota bacterium]
MKPQTQLFGLYVPGRSVIHRLPVGAKYLLVLLGTIPSLLAQQWWLALAVLGIAAAVLMIARLPVRLALRFGWGMGILLALIVGYHSLYGRPLVGLTLATNLLACIWLSRVLTMTTPAPVLVDALVAVARPLDWVGLSSERFGLAVALMLRSIPYLVGLSGDVRNAARARGLERNWFAAVTPVVIGAVAYAQRTGDALAARGLGDDD